MLHLCKAVSIYQFALFDGSPTQLTWKSTVKDDDDDDNDGDAAACDDHDDFGNDGNDDNIDTFDGDHDGDDSDGRGEFDENDDAGSIDNYLRSFLCVMECKTGVICMQYMFHVPTLSIKHDSGLNICRKVCFDIFEQIKGSMCERMQGTPKQYPLGN